MLIRFVVSNFLSFNEEREFTMLSGSFKTHKHHVYNAGKVDVLKAAAIYGANGAGKSNLVKAIDFLQELVKEGYVLKSVDSKKFKLNTINSKLPINLEIEFSINKKIYSYGISIEHTSIVKEWLYESGVTTDDKLIFERSLSKYGKPVIKMSEKYVKSQKSKLLIELLEDNLLKNNELLLNKVENLKIDDITKVRKWIVNNLVVIYPHSKFAGLIQMLTTSERFKSFANQLLLTFDTGINQLATEVVDLDKFLGDEDESFKKELIEDITKGSNILFHSETGAVMLMKEGEKFVAKKVITFHHNDLGDNIHFELDEESDGTQRLLDFIPAFDVILNHDMTVIVDEIDHSLHPVLLKALVSKIMNDNTTQGQLIFTTHESNLLDLSIFRQDEIWFAEKDKKTRGTQLYSLSEYKPRYDLDIRKGYLKGRFRAIPFLAHLEDLKWQSYDA